MLPACVLCGCREGCWRSPDLPGLTVDFLHGVSGSTIADQSFISLCCELSYAGQRTLRACSSRGAGLVRTTEKFSGNSCMGLGMGVGVAKPQFWDVCR